MKITGTFSACWQAMLVALMLVMFRGYAQGQCASVQAIYKVGSGSADKCYFTEFTDPSTPPRYYLQETIVNTDYLNHDYNNENNGCLDLENGEYYSWDVNNSTASFNTVETITCDSLDCTPTTSWSGTVQWQIFYSTVNEPDEPSSSSSTMNSAGDWLDGGDTYDYAIDYVFDLYGATGSTTTSSQTTPVVLTSSTSGSLNNSTNFSACAGSTSEATIWSLKETSTTTLSHEYTDNMLINNMKSAVNSSFSAAQWMTNYADSFGSAFYDLSSDHASVSGGKMQYYFHISDCQPNTSYLVTWDQVTTYTDGSANSVQHMQEDVEGSGDPVNGVDSSTYTVDVPGVNCIITVDNVSVTYQIWNISL
jgi:hypothetical protein